MSLLWLLGSRIRKDLREIKKNSDLNQQAIKHTSGRILFAFSIYSLVGLFLSSLIWIDQPKPIDLNNFLLLSLWMFILVYFFFLFLLRYEKKCVDCHLRGKVISGTATRQTRMFNGVPFIEYEFQHNGIQTRSSCVATSSMIKNFRKGQSVHILLIPENNHSWIVERCTVPLICLSNSRKEFLLKTLSEQEEQKTL